ncbi:uncharacterized protein RSE6_14972 [Rhynchosporium secalis]|uniref:Tc1-like transposase DDE domain-containing protein n=1 Tax=Rhynchosporium secalis TaxID=38038 RepID=A0A1E1MWH2_RHYSE|nr:uncharacterized protein RSE6_14972 [Rhynchosporium secalis]
MLPQRTPLSYISRNRFKGCEISPYMQGQVAIPSRYSLMPTFISRLINLPRSIVKYTLAQDELRDEGVSLLRKAKGKSYIIAEERKIIRHVRLNPKDIYKEVIKACQLEYKITTLKKILVKYRITNWRYRKRPELIEKHATQRRSKLYIIDRDFKSKKHGYSAELYLEVLEAEVKPIFEELDNNRLTRNWPPYSPDLNPIEHI